MSEKLRELGQRIQDKLNNEQSRRRWQAIIGVTFMIVFVVTSIVANKTVFAVNQAAGGYGYYGNYGYGYSGASTSSDAIPAAPTALSAGTPTQTAATLTWTAPTLTTTGTAIATGTGSIASYNIAYQTSSAPSSCTSGSHTDTSTTYSKALSATLTAGTTYYVAICAVDNNDNMSADLTGSFTTASAGGGGGGGGSAAGVFSGTTVVPSPSVPGHAVVTGDMNAFLAALGDKRSATAETKAKNTYVLKTLFGGSAPTSAVDIAVADKVAATIVYCYGLSAEACKKGEREIAGAIGDDIVDVVGVEKAKAAILDEKALVAADAMLRGEGVEAAKALRAIDYKLAFEREKKLLPLFLTLTGISVKQVVAWKTTDPAKYHNFWDSFARMPAGTRLKARNINLERGAIRFVQARLPIVNRELKKQDIAAIPKIGTSLSWKIVRAVLATHESGVKKLL